jgi:hypothetical protein
MSIENLAERISESAQKKDGNYGIDPITISIIISIVTNLIKLWWACKDKQSIKGELQNPSLIFKVLLKREIRKRARREDRTALYGAFLDVVPALTEQEINEIIKQIGEQE